MAQSWEEVVRPFSPTQITPGKQGVENVPAVVPDVVVMVGGSGASGHLMQGQINVTITSYMIKYPKETRTS